MSLKYIYISIISLILLFSTIALCNKNEINTYTLLSKQSEYIAGNSVNIEFAVSGNSNVLLYCSNSYGSIVLDPNINANKINFLIPQSFANKSGILNWQLQVSPQPINGQVNILPKKAVKTIESYLGPPSIEAGGTDYTMLVVIPTDHLDNPIADSTNVTIKHLFLSNETTSEVTIKNGFAYKNIFSEKQSGRIIISSECLDLNSKEYDVNVVPAIPSNFEIDSERIHNYADGNQIATLKTSIIKDRFDNIISDGTFVTFFITNKNGYKAKTSGLSINGIATAKMIHPDYEDQWDVRAYIEGMANSNSITLNFKKAISDYNVQFSKDNRTLTIGPIKSFMDQRVPDGLIVKLKIYKDGVLQNETIKNTNNGFAEFTFSKDRYPNGSYHIELKVAGITKTFSDLTYE